MKIALKGLWDSAARTIVPLVVGGIVSWLLRMGLPLDESFEEHLRGVLDLALAGIYWLIVRLFEIHVSPRFSILLGSTKQPMVYARPDGAGVPVITAVQERPTSTTVTIATGPPKRDRKPLRS